MKKSLGYIAGVIVLLALGAGVAWYVHGIRKQDVAVQREGEQSTTGVHAPSVASRTAEDAIQAPGVSARAINDQTRAFADAVGSATAVLDPNLTNVTGELIAHVFKGLSDPTDIIPMLQQHTQGSAAQRTVARLFYEYMRDHYSEERLQACAHFMLALCVDTAGSGTLYREALQRRIQLLETVIALPSKSFWYSPALDLLGHSYQMLARDTDSAAEKEANYRMARAYHIQRYQYHEQRPGERELADECIYNTLSCWASQEEKQLFYNRWKNRRFSTRAWHQAFKDAAAFYGLQLR